MKKLSNQNINAISVFLIITSIIFSSLAILLKFGTKIKKVDIKFKFQTETFYEAYQHDIKLNLKKIDVQSPVLNLKLFNLSAEHLLIVLNNKIGVVDINKFIEKMSTVLKDKKYGPDLYAFIIIVELSRICKLNVKDFFYDGQLKQDGEDINSKNFKMLCIWMIESLIEDDVK